MKTISFSQILDDKYGQIGSIARDAYEEEAQAFRIGILLKRIIEMGLGKKMEILIRS
jgi:hypothetical protein